MKLLSINETRQINGGDNVGPMQWAGRIVGKVAGGFRSFADGLNQGLK